MDILYSYDRSIHINQYTAPCALEKLLQGTRSARRCERTFAAFIPEATPSGPASFGPGTSCSRYAFQVFLRPQIGDNLSFVSVYFDGDSKCVKYFVIICICPHNFSFFHINECHENCLKMDFWPFK